MHGLNGSSIKYLVALSATVGAVAGSTNASDFSGFEHGTILIAAGSAASGAGFVVNVMRSGTSNGTFASFGASAAISAKKGEGLRVRSFLINTSAVWHKASYDNNNGGSVTPVLLFALQRARLEPVDQATDTTVFSDIVTG